MCLVVKVESYAVKSLQCSTWVQSQKWQNDLCFQGKPFNIIVIQDYAPNINAEEAEVEQFYEDLQDLLELTPKKFIFIIGDSNAKAGMTVFPCLSFIVLTFSWNVPFVAPIFLNTSVVFPFYCFPLL